jgi:LuxR family maltose regulon positive regulatory protein
MAYIEYYRFQLLLKQGNLTAAAAWVEAHAGQAEPLNPYALYRLAEPQLLIAYGSFDAARDKLAALIQEAQDTGHGSLLIKALVLHALAFDGCGNNSQALTTLEWALTLAEPEGFVRSFVDEGEPIAKLLRQAQSRGIRLNYVNRLLAAFKTKGLKGKGLEETSPLLSRSLSPPLIETLSPRELELLRLVAAGHSNKEAAQELFVAIGTVKKHLNNIYGKLGVSSRTQAVARAREFDLL